MSPSTAPFQLPLGSAFTPSGSAPRSCFIACLDVLGFRSRLATKGLVETYNDYVDLRSAVAQGSKVVQLGTLFSQTVGLVTQVPAVVLSDSTYAWADDTTDAGTSLVTACGWIVAEALRRGIPVRGGIARGEAIVDAASATFVGQPMVDAYVTEQVQEWLGLAIHPSASTLVGQTDDLVSWDVPVKRPTILQRLDALVHRLPQPGVLSLTHAVAWHHYLHGDEAKTYLRGLRDGAGRSARHKYDLTLRFVEGRPVE